MNYMGYFNNKKKNQSGSNPQKMTNIEVKVASFIIPSIENTVTVIIEL